MAIISKTVNDEVFLQGNYLNLAINGSGTIGSESTAPVGIFTNKEIGYIRLGMWADFDKFGKGNAPTISDVMLKGLPVEGFSVGYSASGKQIVRTNHERSGYTEISGTSSNASTATVARTNWTGTTSENVKVSQSISLTEDGKYVRVDVTMTNTSANAVGNVRYMRTIDPDQGTDFNTSNKIVEQDGSNGALVSATANGAAFFYYAKDVRAVVSTYGSENIDPYAAAAYSSPQSEGYTIKSDQSVNITFALGTLGANASTSFTFFMGVTDDLTATLSAIDTIVSAPTNTSPTAVDDVFNLVAGGSVTGNLLANDSDRDRDVLSASLKSVPTHGKVTLKADGSFTYAADATYTGTDTFQYSVSDGKASDVATVKLTVAASPTPPPIITDPILTRVGTQDSSTSLNQIATGPDFHNSFFVDSAATSGNDLITNFAHDDVFVTTRALYDGNKDGLISFDASTLRVDNETGGDMVQLSGVTTLRALGQSSTGLFVYADADTSPAHAIESKLGNTAMTGDAGDRTTQTFFFDTALDLDLGNDTITNFGGKDIIVTTSALSDANSDGIVSFGTHKYIDLVAGSGAPGDRSTPGEAGHVSVTDIAGATVTALEFDGSLIHDGTTYYVYSLTGSSAGVATLHF